MKQDQVIAALKNGASLRSSTNRRDQYKLLDKKQNPQAYISRSMFNRLLRNELIFKKGNEYIFKRKSDRNLDKVEYACTFVGHGKSYRISASSVGKAKYQLWIMVKKQKPSVPYSAMRGKLYVPVERILAPDIGKTAWSDRQLAGADF